VVDDEDVPEVEPDYRFTLANERTFLAWIRTSLALLAGGVAVIKLVPSFSLSGGRHILGIPLVVLSVALSLWAYRHWAEAERAMRLKQPLPPSRLPSLLGMAVGLIGIVALALLAAGSGHS
jgi:putative membrane protein